MISTRHPAGHYHTPLTPRPCSRQTTRAYRSSPRTPLVFVLLIALILGLLTSCSGRRSTFRSTTWTEHGVRYTRFKAREFRTNAVVAEHGRRAGPTVLLVHGVGDKAALDWVPVERALASRYRVLTVHLPGFGRSAKANLLYSPERYARFLVEVVKEIARRPVILIGHSMGGTVCLRFAAASPELVERLVLVDVAGVLHRQAFVNHVMRQQIDRLGGEIGARMSSWGARFGAWGAHLGRYAGWLEPVLQLGGERLLGLGNSLGLKPELALRSKAGRRAMLRGDPSKIAGLAMMLDRLGAAIGAIHAQTLLIWGQLDPIAPLRTGYLLRARLPHARLAVIPGAHHVPMKERSAAFNRLLLEHLAGAAVGTPVAAIAKAGPPALAGLGPSALRIARCDHRQGQVISGSYDVVIAEKCEDLRLENLRADRLQLVESTVSLRDVVVEAKPGQAAIEVSESRLWITGGRLRGEPAIASSGSHLDLAGVQIEAKTAVRGGAAPGPIVASACTVAAPDGAATPAASPQIRQFHGYWQLRPGRTLP